jgi:hypothetical protein
LLAPDRWLWQHRPAIDECVVLLHVATAFWFVAGLLGRNVTMARPIGGRPPDARRDCVRARARGEGAGRGHDRAHHRASRPAVHNARAAELVVVAVIVTLMVTKPF